ncbi:MAG: TatD family hydrolase [Prosthecobacter sp.]|jgi:TatD DNase family protein|uniref:TatD family hydrolase n=1 Tax=Prosthecobacter sp. TaxID=1965333 RepID=UPI0019D8BD2A|nr:TatD family hydrolase [Prosthecobacter sp.]MBE2286364.1 TatD family hydrolase [Prosthecobacter sp.]
MFFDSHTHLGSKQFAQDLPAVLERARAAGVSRMVAPATDLTNARELLAMAEKEPDVRVAVGIHPCDVDSVSGEAWIDELRELARHPKVCAIGEIGLDYFHAPPDGFTLEQWRAHQATVLTAQLELAAQARLNVILHNRESWEDLTALVLPFSDHLRGVFHCYTGTFEQARPLLDRGHLISFTGIVSFKNPGAMADTARVVPAEGYMIETDAPYLAPVPHRGKRCEPAYVADTARAIAALRGETPETVAADTTRNALAFFRGWD